MLNKRFGHDIFWAGFVGFLIGILFSFTVWAGNRVLETRSQLTEDDSLISTILGTKLNLSLTSPSDSSIVTSPTVSVIGTVSSPSTILVSGGSTDVTTQTDGKFTVSYTLLEGENEISVTAIDADGRQASTTRSVFYTTEAVQ